MNKHLNISVDANIDYERELNKLFENSKGSKNQVAYYYADRDTNPLKNVSTSRIDNLEITQYHRHDFYEINYVVSGILHENISGNHITLTAGSMLVMAPGVFHTCVPEAGSECYNILFKSDYLKRAAVEFRNYDPNNYLSSLTEKTIYTVITVGGLENEVSSTVRKVHTMTSTLIHHADLYENLALENTAYELLLLLTKIPRQEYDFESGKQRRRENFTPDNIVRYINDNFDKISLSDTALHFGYSECQLHRILKKHTGYTFTEIILNMRMQRARHYLLNTHLPIKNVAYLLGIDSAEHFSRMFKKHRKMTPKEYRDLYMRTSLKASTGKKKKTAK